MSAEKTLKKIYFVRHGATDATISGDIQQGPDTPLNEIGIKQSKEVAGRLSSVEFTNLFSSPARRAIETAEVIAKETGKTITQEGLVIERKRPSRFAGMKKNDPEYTAYRKLESEHLLDQAWKFEDSESFDELLARAAAVIKKLEATEGDSVIVSHEYVCKFLVSCLLLRGSINATNWNSIYQTLRMSNCGVTMCTFDGSIWQVMIWNDCAHFAE